MLKERFSRRARLGGASRRLTVLAVVGGAAVLIASSPIVSAVTPPPDMVVQSGGQTPGTVSNGTPLTVSSRTPLPEGDVTQVIESTWEPDTATLDPASVVAPEGFNLEYRTGTSTWSASPPVTTSTITGVRATGAVNSLGYLNTTQVSQSLPQGDLAPGGGSFQGQSGGDGWDVFFSHPNPEKVLNIWHHLTSINMDCNLRSTGTQCPGGVFTVAGYSSSNKSGGGSWNNKVYVFTKSNTAPHPAGMLCIDISGATPSNCGFTPLIASTGTADVGSFSEPLQVGSKVYGFDMSTDLLACFDAATGQACANQPYNLGVTGGSTFNTYLEVSGSKIFVAGEGKLGCFDTTTGTPCVSPFPLNLTTTAKPIGADGSGGICYLDLLNRGGADCVSSAGTTSALPVNLSTMLTNGPIGGLHASYGSVVTNESTNRLYWGVGADIAPALKTVACFDFTTGASCSGYTAQQVVSGSLYALVLDPANPRCVWGNGDNGQISSFNALTGTAGCASSSPEMVYPYNETVPRFSCDAAGRVSAWRQLRVELPAGMVAGNTKITINDSSGLPITGWTDVPGSAVAGSVTVSGQTVVYDLSALSVGQTGLTPEFRVITPSNTTNNDAQQVEINVTYESALPELCFNLTAVATCPSGVGLASSGTPPSRNPSLRTVSYQGVAGTTTSASSDTTLTMAAISNCVGTVQGRAVDESSQPVPGAPVELYAGSTFIASGVTGADGYATFANVYPFTSGALELRFAQFSSWVPLNSLPEPLSTLGATATVSAQKVFRLLPVLDLPTTTTTTVPRATTTTTVPRATTTTVPGSSTPSTSNPSPNSPTTTTPVPVNDVATGSLPQVPRGSSVAVENGQPVEVLIEVLDSGNGLTMRGVDFEMRLAGESNGVVLPSTDDGVLRLVNGGMAQVGGFGFLPGSWVDVWLFSEPRYLGSLLVDANGDFEGLLPIPPDTPVGEHTLQANGTTVLNTPRSLNLGVDLVAASDVATLLPATGSRATYEFALGILSLTIGIAIVRGTRRRRWT